jgi:hypothetical protein
MEILAGFASIFEFYHCCPVKSGMAAANSMILNAVLTIWGGVDLNSIWHFLEGFRGGASEQWEDAFRPTDGFSAMEYVHPDCRAIRG